MPCYSCSVNRFSCFWLFCLALSLNVFQDISVHCNALKAWKWKLDNDVIMPTGRAVTNNNPNINEFQTFHFPTRPHILLKDTFWFELICDIILMFSSDHPKIQLNEWNEWEESKGKNWEWLNNKRQRQKREWTDVWPEVQSLNFHHTFPPSAPARRGKKDKQKYMCLSLSYFGAEVANKNSKMKQCMKTFQYIIEHIMKVIVYKWVYTERERERKLHS